MLLEVRDFLSIKHARLQTDQNHAIIAGRNGCGKSQFLVSFVCRYGGGTNTLANDFGVSQHGTALGGASIVLDPEPTRVVYYPPQRDVGSSSKSQAYSPVGGTQFWRPDGEGLNRNVANRINNLHRRLVDLANAASLKAEVYASSDIEERDEAVRRWSELRTAFERLTGNRLAYRFAADKGGHVGIELGHDEVSDFYSLSSGEKEIASLLLDITLCTDRTLFVLDEVELHLHPSLQDSLLDELSRLVPADAFLLMSTHSPTVLISERMRSSWWMHDARTAEGGNQLQPIGGHSPLTTRVFDLYTGCSTARAVPEILILAQDEEFGRFLDQCVELSSVVGVDDRTDTDTQVASIRDTVVTLLAERDTVTYLDLGCGEGRCLKAFAALGPDDQARMRLHMVDLDGQRLGVAKGNLPAEHSFPEPQFASDLSGVSDVDYAVLANVFHEIVGQPLVECLTQVWNALRPGGLMHVLEMAELIVGERGFLSLSAAGYEVLLRGLGVEHPVVHPYPTRSGIVLLSARATRPDGSPVDEGVVRDAYVAALDATRVDCLAKLAEDTRGSRRAFWLENLASVDRTLEEMA